MGIGELSWKEGGKEKWSLVELTLLISSMVNSAATVFLNIPFTGSVATIIAPFCSFVSSLSSSMGNNTSSMVFSHSLTRFETRSVVKNGCFSTFWMKGNRNNPPVRLSYFFNIFANPTNSQPLLIK
uniref:Uncharacterized protein n=1 Tax=Gossypium raimondii TaxID=29730 RepID=A0A0D2T3Z6_GOSRA|nr:hypothetical protein B456_008G106300 [Gossypium raimondii]